MNENKNLKKGLGIHARRFIAYVVLILVTFACLFWFYVLFINANTSGMAGYDKQSDRIGTVSSVMYLFFNHDSLCDPCI